MQPETKKTLHIHELLLSEYGERVWRPHDPVATLVSTILSQNTNDINRDRAFEQLRERFDQYAAMHPDDLTVIKGIGRIYQWKLRDAGYSTYGQLADADADELCQLLDVKSWQNTDPQSWIDQTKMLIQRREHRQEE